MLYILTILVVLLAAVGIGVLVKRRIDRDLLESDQPKQLTDTHLRPLFEADDEESRLLETNEAAVVEADLVNEERDKKLAKLDELRQTWGDNPTRRNAVNLLLTASETESADAYSSVVTEITSAFDRGRIEDLSSADLADLIEKHLWLLPSTERMSGTSFVVKQEIETLRKRS